MRKKQAITILIIICLLNIGAIADAQQTLWFGTVKIQDKVSQGRFEVFSDSLIKAIVYAPYGISPTDFRDVRHRGNQLSFLWKINQLTYHCTLLKQDSSVYTGNCIYENIPPIQLTIRGFTEEDAMLQGNAFHATQKDIQILDRALSLLNSGINWNRSDNRICDNSSYPYKWSLFCALHQASIDVDSEYRHLRPAIRAARQAIDEVTGGKKYAHLLQDFNNEAKGFDSIEGVLNRAKEIIAEKIKTR